MSVIAGLKDYRKHGAPGDIGTFVKPCNAICFQFDFSGTTYYVAISVGVSGWVPIDQGIVAATVINAALTLVGGEDDGEVVVLAGAYAILATLNVPESVFFRGVGWATIFNYNAGGNCITITGDTAKIRDLKIVIVAGAGDVGTRPNGIYSEAEYGEILGVHIVGDNSVADDASDIRQCGILISGAGYWRILDNYITLTLRHGINLYDGAYYYSVYGNILEGTNTGIFVHEGSDIVIGVNNLLDIVSHGIILDNCLYVAVTGNYALAGGATVYVTGASHNEISGNKLSGDTSAVYLLASSEQNTVVGNQIHGSTPYGVHIDSSNLNTVTGNTVHGSTSGVYINGSTTTTVTGNTFVYNTYHGINVVSSSHNTVISGNTASLNTRHGIFVEGSDQCTITGNACIENDRTNTGTYDGICLDSTSDDTLVMVNTCNDNDRYGISNAGARNWIKNNQLRNNTSGPFLNTGANTKLAVITLEFNKWGGGSAGLTAPVINTSPGGIDIDADDEFAYVDTTLPEEVQQVVQIKIWAYSNVIEATNNILLRLVAHGATSSEQWSGNPIDVVNEESIETGGIIVGDVIHWVFTVADDAQIGTLAAQDYMEIMAVGEAAAAPDAGTDALFGGVEIEYV